MSCYFFFQNEIHVTKKDKRKHSSEIHFPQLLYSGFGAPWRRPAGYINITRYCQSFPRFFYIIVRWWWGEKKKNLLFIVVIVIKVSVLSSRCRPPCPAGATSTACGFLLSSDEVYDGGDDGAVLRLTVLPVYRSRVTNFLLQQRIQLFL